MAHLQHEVGVAEEKAKKKAAKSADVHVPERLAAIRVAVKELKADGEKAKKELSDLLQKQDSARTVATPPVQDEQEYESPSAEFLADWADIRKVEDWREPLLRSARDLAKEAGFRTLEVEADGSCFFYALLVSHMAKRLRADVADWAERNWKSVAGPYGLDKETFVSQLRTDLSWAEGPALAAAAGFL